MSHIVRPRQPLRTIEREALVLSKAVGSTAQRLELTNAVLARILGVSASSVSRLRQQEYILSNGNKEFELGALLVRLYRSLDAIVGGDDMAARSWLNEHNTVLGGKPIDLIQTINGLTHAVIYVDARRACL